ncbi:EAL domain-containing protein [Pengzhenrongella sicca]|uniref:EAL domain-containing protein n=1 Tax=Pengzhenrongella sicca TaxID=2819238 RepID=A0A8A4ZCN3_9MICO|nr:EAL domain-containing protein [Pengzhenrongella sicca]QTE29692.1 EAL domain-containing protein [Pengzhenrongella sicca]
MTKPLSVLVLTPSIGGHYFGEFLTGLRREVTAAGGRLVVVQTLEPGTHSDEVGTPGSFAIPVGWAHVDGAVSITSAVRGSYLRALRDGGTPVVLVSTRLPDFEAPLAIPDNELGTNAAVEHLIGHGHTRIGFVGNLAQHDVRRRLAAYRRTLAEHGLAVDPDLLFGAPDNAQTGGARAARDVLAASPRPTALMVATDRNAVGLMRALTEAGLRMPEDLAVVGFDNTEAAVFSAPTLSSVDQRFDEVGALAGRLVLAQIRGEDVPNTTHSPTAVSLALRESCGCAGDSLTTRFTEAGRATEGPQAPPLLDQLHEALANALSAPARLGGTSDATESAIRAVVRSTELAVAARDAATGEQIRSLTASLRRLAPRPDVLRQVTGAVIAYLQRSPSERDGTDAGATTDTGAARLEAELWQLQAGAFLRQAEHGETAIEEQYVVDAGLLDAARANPRHLGWLEGTHVRAGVLALWDEDSPASGVLRVVGRYDPAGNQPDLVGTTMTVQDFPPAALVDAAAAASEHSLCIVLPVHTREHEWGMLCVVGEIDTTSARETYYHWAALLCGALEAEHLQAAVRVSEKRYALVARATNDGLWEWELGTRSLYVSDRCVLLVGFEPGLPHTDLDEWRARVHPDDCAELGEHIGAVVRGEQETTESEFRFEFPDGSYHWMLCRALGVRAADDGPATDVTGRAPESPTDGPVRRLVGSLADIDERRSLEDQLRESALHDALTTLPNRRLFLERLEHALDMWRRSQTPFAVLFLDLDGFKLVNDSLGHQIGDRLLHEVGARIKEQLRTVDTGSRFGGDEFAILLHDVQGADVLTVARRVQAGLARVIDLDGHELAVQASLGVATSAIGYASAEAILRDADTAMYHAKATERGSIAFFDAEMNAQAVHQLSLQAEIRRAYGAGQFEVHYQPIVDLVSGRTEWFEALVRWRHPERGLLLPADFLPLVEDMGLSVQLGYQIVDAVCDQLAEWGTGVAGVAVNLSTREFWHEPLLTELLERLTRHGLDPGRLTLQVTEGVLMDRPEAALRHMRALHDAGLRLAIDNFGTGHSSLETLHRFPVDSFTIDRSWIHGLGASATDRTENLVRATVAIGTALGLNVVASGIETAEQLAVLQELGCAAGQGFWFAPAVPPDRALSYYGRSPRTVAGMEHR